MYTNKNKFMILLLSFLVIVALVAAQCGTAAPAEDQTGASGDAAPAQEEAAEAEELVDDPLELQGALLALLVVDGEAPQPVGAHLHVGDLVGEHPVLAELEHRVAGDVAELAHRVEDVEVVHGLGRSNQPAALIDCLDDSPFAWYCVGS